MGPVAPLLTRCSPYRRDRARLRIHRHGQPLRAAPGRQRRGAHCSKPRRRRSQRCAASSANTRATTRPAWCRASTPRPGSGQAVPVDEETAGLLDVCRAAACAQRRPFRHHLGGAAPRLGLSRRAGAGQRRSRGPAAADRLAAGAVRQRRRGAAAAPAWRSTSAASARSTPPTALRCCCARPAWPAAMSTWAATSPCSAHAVTAAAGAARIRHPRRDDALIDTLELGAGALATSGDYERYFEADGVAATAMCSTRAAAGP